MKEKTLLFLFLLTVITTGCSLNKQSKKELSYIDATKNYPTKELILTDIADVTYVHLNSDNIDYLYSGYGVRRITKNTIVVYDNSSGAILFFFKDGKPKSRFNRQGRGPGEYMDVSMINYDEKTDDVFVGVFFPNAEFIQVYSSTGEHKRTITMPGVSMSLIINFDEHSLFVYDANYGSAKLYIKQGGRAIIPGERCDSPFFLISKTDGAIIDNPKLPEKDIILMDPKGVRFGPLNVIKCPEGVLLCNPDADTVFLYSKDKSLTPVLYKTPAASSADPMVILNNCIDVGRYQFMELITVAWENRAYPIKYYLRDKKTGEIFRQKLVLPEYRGKEFFIGPFRSQINYENGAIFELDLLELKQAYRENRLSGKLKELVATLKEDDNNIFMLVQFK